MANPFTDGRQALLARLQADPTLDAAVTEWHEWGSGLIQRYDFLPASCPLISVAPAALDEDDLSNITDRFPQSLEIVILTDGQDAEPGEELLAAALAVVQQARADRMGLAAEGLAGINPQSTQWDIYATERDPRPRWLIRLRVELIWYLRELL